MTQQIQEIIDGMLDDPVYEDDAVVLKTYIERLERSQTPDWFSSLTADLFKLYGFEWDHNETQENNIISFINCVEEYGYYQGREDERYSDD